MHSRTLPRPDPPAQVDDPFADLLDDLEAEETHQVPADDRHELRRLFEKAPRRPSASASGSAPPGSPWPTHNFGPAYDTLRRDRRIRPGPKVLAESDLWDVDQLTHEPPAEEAPATAAPMPWRTSAPRGDPTGWLDTLTVDLPAAETTEARLVDLVWGGPRQTLLLEATEILHARPRRARLSVPVRRQRRVFPRSLEVAGLAVLLLFALAVLQLLLS